jgi:type II secretory pathway pseudopilin PulG
MMLKVVRWVRPKMEAYMRIGKMQESASQMGFTFMGLLMVVAISGIALAGVGIVWRQDAQREREKELLFIGDQYRKAILSYYESKPPTGASSQYPKKLEDLLLDKRFPEVKRHLRKLYLNPLKRDKAWRLVFQQGAIVGVYYDSAEEPIKKSGFLSPYESFNGTVKYSDWKFVATGNNRGQTSSSLW